MLPRPPTRLLLTALGGVLCMAFVPVLVRAVNTNEITIALARLFIALALLSPWLAMSGLLRQLRTAPWRWLTAAGIVFACHWLTYFFSIKLAGAAVGALGIATYSVHLVWLEWLLEGKRPGWIGCAGMGICALGVVLVAPEFSWRSNTTQGLVIAVFSGWLYGCLPFLHRRALPVAAPGRAWAQFTIAFLVLIPLFPWTDWQLSQADYARLAALGTVCTLLAHTLWLKASTELPALYSGLIYYLYVPTSLLLGWWFLGEKLLPQQALGATFIVGGSALCVAVMWWQHQSRSFRSMTKLKEHESTRPTH